MVGAAVRQSVAAAGCSRENERKRIISGEKTDGTGQGTLMAPEAEDAVGHGAYEAYEADYVVSYTLQHGAYGQETTYGGCLKLPRVDLTVKEVVADGEEVIHDEIVVRTDSVKTP